MSKSDKIRLWLPVIFVISKEDRYPKIEVFENQFFKWFAE
jgi:hypothetical protein